MSELVERIRRLVETGEVRISEHGYDELSDDRIPVRDVIRGILEAVVVEEYPESGRGSAVLVLEYDRAESAHSCRMGNTGWPRVSGRIDYGISSGPREMG